MKSLRASVPLILLVAAFSAAAGARQSGRRGRAFVPYVASAQPQGALGDFDGDGRTDIARIQERDGVRRVSIRLAASFNDVQLETSVAALIDADIDHDGDLDLVGATASGDVVVWLNDGHGTFTRQAPSRSHTLYASQTALDSGADLPAAVSATVACTLPPEWTGMTGATLPARTPCDDTVILHRFWLPAALRAPPARLA